MAEGGGIVEPFIQLLVSLGLPGLVIAALLFAVHRLYNRNQELQATLLDITRETTKSQEAGTASINRLSDLLLRGRASE